MVKMLVILEANSRVETARCLSEMSETNLGSNRLINSRKVMSTKTTTQFSPWLLLLSLPHLCIYVASISESFPDAMLILGGDLNVDISRDTTHTSEFVRFCSCLLYTSPSPRD